MKYLWIILFCLPIKSYGQSWSWVRSSACANGNEELCMTAFDKYSSLPGLYCAGAYFNDSICFPPFIIRGVVGETRFMFAKYDTAGAVLWALGDSNGQSAPMNITSDAYGNLFVLGMLFTDSVMFDGHSIVNPNYIVGGGLNKNHCFFIMKVDPFGHFKWAKCGGNVGEKGENAVIGGVTVDAVGNVYISASYDSSGLQIGSHFYPNSFPHHDSEDFFIAKYDSSGNFIWCKTFGGVGDEHAERLLIGSNNKLYLEGFFNTPSLNIGSTVLTLSPFHYYAYNVFLSELDTAGNVIWAMNPSGNAYTFGLALDHYNNIYISGAIYDTVMAFGTHLFNTQMLYRGSFLAKLDTGGTPLWENYFYPLTHIPFGSFGTRVSDIAIDPCDNVWITGRLVPDSIALNNTTLFHTPVPAVVSDDGMLFAGFDSVGHVLQAYSLYGGGDDNAGIVSDCNGNLYIAGDTRRTFVLGSDTAYEHNGENMFVAKYNPNLGCSIICGSTIPPDAQTNPTRAAGLSVYPCPAVDQLYISSPTPISCVSIFNAIGQAVITEDSYSNKVQINVSTLTAGLYFIKINNTEIRRFIKN